MPRRRKTLAPTTQEQIFRISSNQPLLLVVINGGNVTAVADRYGMRVAIDTRAGTPAPKQLPSKPARTLVAKDKRAK